MTGSGQTAFDSLHPQTPAWGCDLEWPVVCDAAPQPPSETGVGAGTRGGFLPHAGHWPHVHRRAGHGGPERVAEGRGHRWSCLAALSLPRRQSLSRGWASFSRTVWCPSEGLMLILQWLPAFLSAQPGAPGAWEAFPVVLGGRFHCRRRLRPADILLRPAGIFLEDLPLCAAVLLLPVGSRRR